MTRFFDLGSSLAAAFGTVCLALGLFMSGSGALANQQIIQPFQGSCTTEVKGNCGAMTLCTSNKCDYSSASCPCQ